MRGGGKKKGYLFVKGQSSWVPHIDFLSCYSQTSLKNKCIIGNGAFATIKLSFNLRMQSIRLCVSKIEHEPTICDRADMFVQLLIFQADGCFDKWHPACNQ